MIALRSNSIRIIFVAIVVLICDQVTKAAAVSSLYMGERVEIVSFLSFERTSNRGIAFGLAGDVPALVLVLLAVAVVFVLLVLGTRLRWRGAPLAIGLILGGALGNLTDRILRGSVVDFIDLPRWPTFNVADIAITLGVILLIVGSLRSGGRG